MKKALCLVLSLLLLAPLAVHAEDIIYIGSFSELKAVSARVAAGDSLADTTVVLTADITADSGLVPIGVDKSHPFEGHFDGNGHTISGLTVEGEDYLGLFGCVNGGTVENITLENVSINGKNYVGGIVGRLYSYGESGKAELKNCTVSGSVVGESYVGGVAGYSAANASSKHASVSITDSSFDGDASGKMYVGGIAGKSEAYGNGGSASVSRCLAVGSVEAVGSVGSLAGGILGGALAKDNAAVAVEGCAFDGNAYARIRAAGGIVGSCGEENAAMAVSGCAAYGTVNSVGGCGGIAYEAYADIKGCTVGCTLLGDDIHTVAKDATAIDCYAYKTAFPASGVTLAESLPIHSLYAPRDYKKGDADGNGDINAADAALILRADVRLCSLGLQAAKASDTTNDGKISSADASWVLRYDVGLIAE